MAQCVTLRRTRRRRARKSSRRRRNPSTARARARYARHQALLGTVSGMRRSDEAADRRRLKKLEAAAGLDVTQDTCFHSPRDCCRDRGSGRFASCQLAGNRARLDRARAVAKLREARDARRRTRRASSQEDSEVDPETVAVNPRRKAVRIGVELVEIRYRKADGTLFYHRFDREGRRKLPAVPVMGLPDGSLLIPRGEHPLWGYR